MKILIADDSRTARELVKRHMKQAGFVDHTVLEAIDGVEALEYIKEDQPDIVLCDWNMPGLSGIELLSKVRADGIHLVFGLITSESTGKAQLKAAQEGADFYLTKPFVAAEFQATLGPFLQSPSLDESLAS